jgi:glycosyltransferase involved in cell wall biosynthesis
MDGTDDRQGRPVRVCFAVENLLPAGTERWIVHLIDRLDRRRVQPLLCLTDGQGDESRQLEPADCEVLRLELTQLKSIRTLRAARALYRFLRHHQVDVLQVHHADPSYLGVPTARAAGVPVIVQTKYDIGYWLTNFDLWMHRRLRCWIDVTLANCQACRDAAIAQERASPDEVVVIDNGIDTSRLTQIAALSRDAWRWPLRVGMVANLRPVKDPQNLIDAAHQLIDRSLPISFHLAGQGPLKEALEADVARRGLVDRIILHGHIADMPSFLESLQIVVLCSRSEGLPHALLEAMAAGRAVVATAVGGNRELVQDGVNGLLVPPSDSTALATAIARLATDPALAIRLAGAARRSVADRFGLDAMADRFAEFYRSVSRRSGHGQPRRDVPTIELSNSSSARAELTS